jgi:glycosyltransferase involved in cell wall biosynthesis
VSWNSEFLRTAVPVPATVAVAYEALYVPANPRVPRFASIVRRPADGEPVVFFAGRLDSYKGPDVAIRALAALRDRHGIAARLVLAGDGSRSERDGLEHLAAELALADRVELAGRLDFDEMRERLATCAAWVVPSVWDEPAPTVALEAGLARVPAVLSRVGGTAEMLREGTEALFFARSDHEGCASALAETISNTDATQIRVERAHARAEALSWEHYLQATDEFVDAAADALLTGGAQPFPAARS